MATTGSHLLLNGDLLKSLTESATPPHQPQPNHASSTLTSSQKRRFHETDPAKAIFSGKKTKGRVKIEMKYINNKLRRYTTFSKRKSGIMKKAYELATLTGTQVLLIVASETGHVYTYGTRKLQPIYTSDAGQTLIQACLNGLGSNANGDSTDAVESVATIASSAGGLMNFVPNANLSAVALNGNAMQQVPSCSSASTTPTPSKKQKKGNRKAEKPMSAAARGHHNLGAAFDIDTTATSMVTETRNNAMEQDDAFSDDYELSNRSTPQAIDHNDIPTASANTTQATNSMIFPNNNIFNQSMQLAAAFLAAQNQTNHLLQIANGGGNSSSNANANPLLNMLLGMAATQQNTISDPNTVVEPNNSTTISTRIPAAPVLLQSPKSSSAVG